MKAGGWHYVRRGVAEAPHPGFSQPAALLLLGGAGEIQIVPQVPAWRSPHHQREFARAAFPGYRRPGKSSNRNLSCRGWESRVRAILPRLRGRICSRRIAAGGFRGSLAPLGLRALDRGLCLCAVCVPFHEDTGHVGSGPTLLQRDLFFTIGCICKDLISK